jgi:hypothetical protein
MVRFRQLGGRNPARNCGTRLGNGSDLAGLLGREGIDGEIDSSLLGALAAIVANCGLEILNSFRLNSVCSVGHVLKAKAAKK